MLLLFRLRRNNNNKLVSRRFDGGRPAYNQSVEEHWAILWFDSGLRELLARKLQAQAEVRIAFKEAPAVKHLVESLGVPHTEIGAVRFNGQPAGLERQVQPGDRVELFAVPDGQGSCTLPGEAHFIADNHLGRLAAYLRMLGLDTLYRNDYQDEELAQVSESEGRILLTRDRRLLMRRAVTYGCCLRSLQPGEQFIQVARRYGLAGQARPFWRCLRCNGLLQPVDKAAVLEQLQPLTRRYFDSFALCPACGQVYWQGSHYEHMQILLESICSQDNPRI